MEEVHQENHFTSSEFIKDIVLGMSDGLTVPFALAAGISGAAASTGLVVTAGIAEIVAGAISMGLGGYLAARGESEHYHSELQRERYETEYRMEDEKREIVDIFAAYGISKEESLPLIQGLEKNPAAMVDFMMKFELGLEKPEPRRALFSAATISGAYAVGGFVPLFPYIIFANITVALEWSVYLTVCALFIFGYLKGKFMGNKPWKSAMQTTVIGSMASAVAFFLARLLG
jgi:VIT1/CCC1 family predicted Fe2+/Mn2+ transporter